MQGSTHCLASLEIRTHDLPSSLLSHCQKFTRLLQASPGNSCLLKRGTLQQTAKKDTVPSRHYLSSISPLYQTV